MDLQAIKDAADNKYAPFPVKISDKVTVNLLPPTKLTDAVREKVVGMLEDKSTDGIKDRLEEILVLVAENPTKGRALVKALDGDLGYLTETIASWAASVKAGEASPSVS